MSKAGDATHLPERGGHARLVIDAALGELLPG